MEPEFRDITLGQVLSSSLLIFAAGWFFSHCWFRIRAWRIWGRYMGFQAVRDGGRSMSSDGLTLHQRVIHYTHPVTQKKETHLDGMTTSAGANDWREVGDGVPLLMARHPPHALCSVAEWWKYFALKLVLLMAAAGLTVGAWS